MAKNILRIENARIIFRNFAGAATRFSPAGTRSFAVVIPTAEMANELADAGWNIKQRPPKVEDDDPLFYLNVRVSYNVIPPKVVMVTSQGKQVQLDEDDVGQLDTVDVNYCDIEISPSYWTVNGKSGVKAYLKTLYVNIVEDGFAEKYRRMYEQLPDELKG